MHATSVNRFLREALKSDFTLCKLKHQMEINDIFSLFFLENKILYFFQSVSFLYSVKNNRIIVKI